MGNHVPNFDGMTYDELGAWLEGRLSNSKAQAAAIFPGRPEGYVEAYDNLVFYVARKRLGMANRLEGNIQAALRHEDRADDLYKELPDYARW